MSNLDDIYKAKYLKYKLKYTQLKEQYGGELGGYFSLTKGEYVLFFSASHAKKHQQNDPVFLGRKLGTTSLYDFLKRTDITRPHEKLDSEWEEWGPIFDKVAKNLKITLPNPLLEDYKDSTDTMIKVLVLGEQKSEDKITFDKLVDLAGLYQMWAVKVGGTSVESLFKSNGKRIKIVLNEPFSLTEFTYAPSKMQLKLLLDGNVKVDSVMRFFTDGAKNRVKFIPFNIIGTNGKISEKWIFELNKSIQECMAGGIIDDKIQQMQKENQELTQAKTAAIDEKDTAIGAKDTAIGEKNSLEARLNSMVEKVKQLQGRVNKINDDNQVAGKTIKDGFLPLLNEIIAE